MDVPALTERATRAMHERRFEAAEASLREAIALAPNDDTLHYALAHALYAQEQDAGALDALDVCLTLNPDHPPALLYRGLLLEQSDRHEEALASFLRGIRTAERLGIVPTDPELQRVVAHAVAVVGVALDRHLTDALAPLADRHGGGAIARIRAAADIFVGKVQADIPHSAWRPRLLYIPELTPTLFYDESRCTGIDALNQGAAEIVAEARAALTEGDPGLYQSGQPVDAALASCPKTARALAALELIEIDGYGPDVAFEIVPAGGSVPPRVGPTNGRVVGHFVLEAPEDGARLSVGDEARTYARGEVIVFDDAFRHSIENAGAGDLILLVFDLWNPQLTPAEREALRALLISARQFDSI